MGFPGTTEFLEVFRNKWMPVSRKHDQCTQDAGKQEGESVYDWYNHIAFFHTELSARSETILHVDDE
jgi:hypothetical protein